MGQFDKYPLAQSFFFLLFCLFPEKEKSFSHLGKKIDEKVKARINRKGANLE